MTLLTPAEAARQLQVREKTLSEWRYARTGPAFIKVGRLVRYQQADLDRWIESQRVRPRRAS